MGVGVGVAVAGEMFRRRQHRLGLHAAHEGGDEAADIVRVFAEAACVDDRVVGVAVDVRDGSEAETTRAGTVPVSLSRPVIEGILRNDLGFDGLVIGDAFDMGGLVAHYDAGDAAIRAIEAGTDLILKSANTDAAIAAVKQALRSGRIPEDRIDRSVKRILEAKQRVRTTIASDEEIFRVVDSAEQRRVAAEIATRAVTLLREQNGVLPLREGMRAIVVTVSDFAETLSPAFTAERELDRRLKTDPAVFLVDARSREDEMAAIARAAENVDVVVLALTIRAVSGAGHMKMPDAAKVLVERLPANVPVVAVSFGSPYVLRDLPQLRTYLCAYDTTPVMQRAAVAALFGEAAITGKLPVTIPGFHQRGEGLTKQR